MAELDLQPEPELDVQPVLDLQPVATVQSESLPSVIKDIYQHAGERLAKLGGQLKEEFTSGEAVKPIGGGLPILAHPPDESALGGYARAAYNAPAGLWNAATSPAGLATVGSFALGQPEIGAALIAAQMAPHAGPMMEQVAKAATGQLPPGESAETALNLAMIAAPGVHEMLPKAAEFKPVETASRPEFPVSQKGVTEPPDVPAEAAKPAAAEPVAETAPAPVVTTADLTRQLTDARKGLLAEAQDLQTQADISRAATGQVHPEVQNRINAINEELNHPTVGVPVNADAPAEVLQPNVTAAKVSPDEATRAVAVSPASTTPGDVTAGQQPPQPSGAVGMGGGLGGAVGGAGRGTPVTGGISERSVTADINAGILPADALVIGKGWNAQKAADNGRSLINRGVNPAEVVQAISDPNKAMPRVGGRPLDAADAVSVIHAERERFAAERADAQNRFGLNSPQAAIAENAEAQWLRLARPQAGGLAQRVIVAFQDANPVDIGTFDGLYKKAAEIAADNGRTITQGQKIEMVRNTRKTQVARTAAADSVTKRQKILDRDLPKVRTPNDAEMKALVDDIVKELTPCK